MFTSNILQTLAAVYLGLGRVPDEYLFPSLLIKIIFAVTLDNVLPQLNLSSLVCNSCS